MWKDLRENAMFAAHAQMPEMVTAALQVVRRKFEDDSEEGEIDPLCWWKNRPELGALYPLVRLVFSASPTSAPIERIFSSATFEDDPKRPLPAATIKKLVTLKEFKRRYGRSDGEETPSYVVDAATFILDHNKQNTARPA